jgi:peptide-methionine (R)-S-oxide reductase
MVKYQTVDCFPGAIMKHMVEKPDEEWKKELTPEQYRVLRHAGTELPFNNKYYKNKKTGTYLCAGCGAKLFSSEDKYDSGSGWPSFSKAMDERAVDTQQDVSHGMDRTEVLCHKCGGHLGHVFDDGPKPTGKRFCMNSASLQFVDEKGQKD